MYRKPSGGTGFSFNRLITNAFPNFANDNPERDADLTSTQKDLLWTHQMMAAEANKRQPMTLDEGSALQAGATTSEKLSARIHKELLKNGAIDPSTPLGIDTSRITPKFARQLSFVSVAAQRKVVGMLFFWEQEALRWRLLDQEEAEIKSALEHDPTNHELKIRLESVNMRRAMKPSARPEEGANQAQNGTEPPQYS